VTRTFKTNLRCSACEAAIRPLFDAEPTIKSWKVDLTSADKPLTVKGEVPPNRVAALLEQAGYRSLGEVSVADPSNATTSIDDAASKPSYFPLALIVGYILGVTLLVEWSAGTFDATRAMSKFMAGFFLVFSFFKLLNLTAFADAYATYDIVAAKSRTYALAYPFLELGLGIAYLVRFQPFATNLATLVLMTIGTVGVAKSLVARRQIQCACLGTVFNLPMSSVTLIEDLSMAIMAGVMLVME